MADDISFFSDLHLTKEKITNHILSDLTFHGFKALERQKPIANNNHIADKVNENKGMTGP